MMAKRNSKRPRKDVAPDPPSALKMVLKLSAQEHADSLPNTPGPSVRSHDSDDENSSSKPASKKSRGSANVQQSSASRKEGTVGITAQDFAPPERNLRDRHRAPSPKPLSNALQDTLLYLHRLIEKRDNQHFFAFPINDLIAPDYSSVIKIPMDFSTMKDKIDRKLYSNIMEYKADVRLICVNAMNYNHPDTIYYKAAQRLLEYAMRTLSKDRLLSLRKNQPIMSTLTDTELSLHLDVDASDYIAPARTQKKQRDLNSYLTFEPVPDHLPAKDIIAIAKERAAEAADNLAKKQPNSKMGFLRMDEDGTTTLNIVNPDNTGYINDKERVITIGEKVGKLKAGVPYLESINTESHQTDVKPVRYLSYGPYASGAPTFDSSFSTLTKKESDLVLSYYGTQNGLDYIQSLRAFVADSSLEMIDTIDKLANSWTGGKHTEAQKLIKALRDKASKETEELRPQMVQPPPLNPTESSTTQSMSENPSQNSNVDFESLKSIEELGIDVSFLEYFKSRDATQGELDKTASQITELNNLQSNRLSLLPSNESAAIIPRDEEKAADTLSNHIASLTKSATPVDVVDQSKLRLAMGVGAVPVIEKTDSQIVDELLSRDDEPTEDITPIDALCHTIPVAKSPTMPAV